MALLAQDRIREFHAFADTTARREAILDHALFGNAFDTDDALQNLNANGLTLSVDEARSLRASLHERARNGTFLAGELPPLLEAAAALRRGMCRCALVRAVRPGATEPRPR